MRYREVTGKRDVTNRIQRAKTIETDEVDPVPFFLEEFTTSPGNIRDDPFLELSGLLWSEAAVVRLTIIEIVLQDCYPAFFGITIIEIVLQDCYPAFFDITIIEIVLQDCYPAFFDITIIEIILQDCYPAFFDIQSLKTSRYRFLFLFYFYRLIVRR